MKQFVCDIACVCHMWMAWSQQIKYLQEIDFLKSFSRFQFDLHEKEKSGWFTGLVIVLRTESQEICLANIICLVFKPSTKMRIVSVSCKGIRP